MRFTSDTIRGAFRRFELVYHVKRGWDIPYHAEFWRRADLAFDGAGSFDDFDWLYGQLRSFWQVFRGANGTCWSAQQTFDFLRGIAPAWGLQTLRSFGDEHLGPLQDVINAMAAIKPIKWGTSIVAVSKFLHVLNPRLFVIVDDAVMWGWVFQHRWLWSSISSVRDQVASLLDCEVRPAWRCDALSYLAIMRWCADLLRTNEDIPLIFRQHLRRLLPDETQALPIDAYEAVAAEWFLLGVVELPPAGTTLPDIAGA